jgi:guanosine-3',5'-bis(diphosphate) 3'-pyrophosphohydrolase
MEQLDPTPISAEEFYQMISEYLTPRQVEFVREAYNFAAEKHAAQKRASGEPYIIHPLGVATILAQLKMDDVTLAAAFLHDVVEDTDTTLDQLTDIFGLEVAGLVDGVTKLGKIEYISREEQQVENYRKMFLAMAKDIRVVLIKLADRLHNMRTMKYMPPHKQKRISNETLEIYAPLAHRLGIYAIKWELEDLSFRYLEPQHYYELVEEVKIKRHEREAMVQEAMDELRQLCSDAGIRCEIQGRPKSFYSIYRKMKRDNKTINEIYDLLAVRVLVDSVKDCYGVLGIVHGKWKPIPGRFKDYIAVPKSNGYQSLHTTVVSSSGSPLEIQIRTFEMHKVSEYGVAAHWRYKESGGSKMPSTADKNVDAKMAWLRQLLEWHRDMRDPHEFVDTVKMDVFSDEVFVFTPQGDVIDLPFGSVPIDFAYRIHTGVGNSCVGAKVNGKIVPLDYKLKNGDIVEIITSKTSPGPSRDWIDIVGSSQTKNKIKQFFKKERREENIATGRDMLERECRRLGYDPTEIMTSDTLKDVASRCHLDGSEENLLAALGYGGIMLNTVMVKLIDIYKKQQRKNTTKNLSQLLSELKPRTLKTNKASHGILVKGEDDIMVKLAKCCNPIPGDPIIGYITRGHGVSVHRADCPNVLANKEDADRMIEVSWNIDTDTTYKVVLRLSAVDQPGVMANIMMVASETKVNINSLNAHTNPDKTAYVDLGLDISSLDQLNYIISRMRRIKGVYKVERKISGV